MREPPRPNLLNWARFASGFSGVLKLKERLGLGELDLAGLRAMKTRNPLDSVGPEDCIPSNIGLACRHDHSTNPGHGHSSGARGA